MVEEENSVNVTLQLVGQTDIPLSVRFFTSAGTATGKATVLYVHV